MTLPINGEISPAESSLIALDTIQQYLPLLSSQEYILPAAIVALMHHISVSAISIVLHRSDTHGSVEINESLKEALKLFIRTTTTIIPEEWVAAHKQHHKMSDITWNMESEKLGDPHTPLLKGEHRTWRLVKQFFDVLNTDYFNAINIMYKQRDEQKELGLPVSQVSIERDKPSYLYRYGPAAGLFASYVSLFGFKTAVAMGIGHFVLGASTIVAVNGAGHGANQIKELENARGDYSQNITSTGDTFAGRRWNNFLSFLTGGEEHHGNHHDAMKSADITLDDPKQFDIGYWYLQQLEKLGLASNIKVSTKNKAPEGTIG